MISCAWVIGPLILPIELLDKAFGKQSLHVTNKNDVVLAVEVYPAVVAVLGILALRLARQRAVENLVE